MAKAKKPVFGIKAVKAILTRLAFDPRPPSPLAIVASNENPAYLISRASEELQYALGSDLEIKQKLAHVKKCIHILVILLWTWKDFDKE